MSESNSAVLEAPVVETSEAPKPRKASKPKAKAAKKAPKVKAKEPSKRGPSVRQRVFALLAKSGDGLTGPAIMKKLNLSGVPALLKDEGVCAKPRIRRLDMEDVRGVMYTLTALGRSDLKAGKVDENAAESAAGKDWPNGR